MKYRVAETPEEYATCKALMLKEGFDDQELTFPTIMAIDDNDEVVGFIATTPRTDMVLAGPMVLRRDRRRVFTGIRLVEAYENAMMNMGITSVVFYANEGDSPFVRGLKKWFPDVQPYAKQGNLLFYNWRLGEARRVA